MSGETVYCAKCGATLTEAAAFCSRCGAPVGQAAQPQMPPTGTERRHEKQEKQEKHEKSEKGEKGRGGDISGAIVGGLILIWLGVTFYLQQTNFFPSSSWWAYFLAGLGAIIILQGLIRYAQNRRPFVGPFIGGGVLLLIGLSFLSNAWRDLWPLALVVIGVAVILGSLTARRRNPRP